MKHRLFVSLLLMTALVGCGVKEEVHQAVVDERDECLDQAARWESLYQESLDERQQALDQALAMLPAAHDELRSQIDVRLDRVTEELDAALKAEVQQSFYDLADAIAEGYNMLQQENQQLQVQLAESKSLIETVLEKTGSIETKVGVEQDAFQAKRQALLLRIGDVESFLRDWQYMYVDCNACEERLRINKKERDALAQMHDELITRLASVRNEITMPATGDVEEVPEEEGEGAGR